MEEAEDVTEQIDADVKFHRTLAEATCNPIFVFLLDAMAELLRKSRRQTIGVGGVGPALQGYRAILAAVEKGDPEASSRAMNEHLQASLRDLQNVMKQNKRQKKV